MSSELENFLMRNSVQAAEGLPLIHATKSYNLRSILKSRLLSPQVCDTFLNEKLNYFFVGRPSYKYTTDSSSADHWELPTCFIFANSTVKNVKRIFPFDSGAFRGGRYPDYISMMPWEEFEAHSLDTPERIIGSFFGSSKNYFHLKAKDKDLFDTEFSITPFDAEISALVRLAGEKTSDRFDDRRFAIEIQSEETLNLEKNVPLAVIVPEQYLDEKSVLEIIEDKWGAEAIGYPMYSLSVSSYHALIYREVMNFYKRNEFI